MKRTINVLVGVISIVLIVISCKSKQSQIKIKELPAYQTEKDTEIMQSILNSEYLKSFVGIIIDEKEYLMKDFYKIMDTLNIEKYNVKVETVGNSSTKKLILKST